jgi:hypothetical protein
MVTMCRAKWHPVSEGPVAEEVGAAEGRAANSEDALDHSDNMTW